MRKSVILHVLWGGGIGGTEEYVSSMIPVFDHARFDIRLCIVSKKGKIFDELEARRVPLKYIGMRNGFDLFGAIRLYAYLTSDSFDIIHFHSSNILTGIAGTLCLNSKRVYSEHVGPAAENFFKKRKRFYQLFGTSFHAIIAISDYVKRQLIQILGVDPSKVCVIYNGILENKFKENVQPPAEILDAKKLNNKIVGFLGRLESFKRPDLFIEVAQRLSKKLPSLRFFVVGDGKELANCKEKAIERGLGNKISFLGMRRDIPEILKSFDMLLFLSKEEGFGIVIIEAMAMGVPVVAINEGAVPEIIKHGVNGILVNGVDPDNIAKVVEDLFLDEPLMSAISREEKETVHNNFSIEIATRKTEVLYEKLLMAHKK